MSTQKEMGILFSARMVRAIREGRKTQTRRVLAPQPIVAPDLSFLYSGRSYRNYATFKQRGPIEDARRGAPGQRFWVRETWHPCDGGPIFAADYADGEEGKREAGVQRWYPGIHLRRVDARIRGTITAVRFELLHDITEEDAKAEGVKRPLLAPGEELLLDMPCRTCGTLYVQHDGNGRCGGQHEFEHYSSRSYRGGFAQLWNSINGERAPWQSNPWVRVLTLEVSP